MCQSCSHGDDSEFHSRTHPYTIKSVPKGMGEHEYQVVRNGVVIATTEEEVYAHAIVMAMTAMYLRV